MQALFYVGWQPVYGKPWLTNQELLEILKKSANRYDVPELPYGCGIVDIQKAIDLIETMQEE